MPSGWTRKRGSTWTWYIEDVPDPSTGRPRQVSKGGFRTRKEARDALLEAQAALRSGTFVEPSKRTVGSYLLQAGFKGKYNHIGTHKEGSGGLWQQMGYQGLDSQGIAAAIEELAKAGVMLAGEGLHPTSKAKRVNFSGTKRTVVDGPFAETKELIAGFWLWQVRSMEEAVEWVKRCPNPHPGDSQIEIRPVFEAEDFGAEFNPELREQEDRLRMRIASKK